MSEENIATTAVPTGMPETTKEPSLTETKLALKTVGDELARVHKQVRTMWIAVGVVAVLTVASAGFSFVPRALTGGGPPGTAAGAAATGATGGTSNGTAAGGAQAPGTTGQ